MAAQRKKKALHPNTLANPEIKNMQATPAAKASKAETKAVDPMVVIEEAPAIIEPKEEQIILVPLDQIAVDFPNARSGMEADGKEDENTLEQLRLSIQHNGQEVPVVLRPHPNAQTKGSRPFQIVAGFRRLAAIAGLVEQGLAKPVVKAVLRDLDNMNAARINAVENTGRSNLNPPDVVFAAGAIYNAAASQGITPTNEAIARSMGLSTSYVNKCLTIANKVTPDVIEQWRKSTVYIPLMSVLKLASLGTKSEQREEWKKLKAKAAASAESGTNSDRRGHTAWIGTVEKQASALGDSLAALTFAGIVAIDSETVDWLEVAENAIPKIKEQEEKIGKPKSKVSQEHVERAYALSAAALEMGFNKTLSDLEASASAEASEDESN